MEYPHEQQDDDTRQQMEYFQRMDRERREQDAKDLLVEAKRRPLNSGEADFLRWMVVGW